MPPAPPRLALRQWLYAGASFTALTITGITESPAVEYTVNHDGPAILGNGDTVTFGSSTYSGSLNLDEARVPDGVSIGAGGIVVSPTTHNSGGILSFLGNATAVGTIGAANHAPLTIWTGGGTGTTVTVTGDTWVTALLFNTSNLSPAKAGGTLDLQGNVTSAGHQFVGSSYFAVDGTVKLSGNANVLAGKIFVGTSGLGTIIVNNTGATSIGAAVGAVSSKLGSFIFEKAGTTTFGSNTFINSLSFKADGTAIFNQDTATTIMAPITNNTGTSQQGTVVFATSGKGGYMVTGDLGATGAGQLKRVEIGAEGRAGTVTLDGALHAGTTAFMSDSTLVVAKDASMDLAGAWTNETGIAHQGAITFGFSGSKNVYNVDAAIGSSGTGSFRQVTIGANGRIGKAVLNEEVHAQTIAFGTDAILELAKDGSVTFDSRVINETGMANKGTLRLGLGSSDANVYTITGGIGAAGTGTLRQVSIGTAESNGTLRVGGDIHATTVVLHADNTLVMTRDGAATLAGNVVNMTGTAGKGSVVLDLGSAAGTSTYTVTGDLGAADLGTLKQVAFGAGDHAGTVEMTGKIFASAIHFATNSTLNLDGTYAGPITTQTTGTGTVNFKAGTPTSGDIGSTALPLNTVGFQSGLSSLNHNVHANMVSIAPGAKLTIVQPDKQLSVTGGIVRNQGSIMLNSVPLTIAGNYDHGGQLGVVTLFANTKSAGKMIVLGNVDTTGGLTIAATLSNLTIAPGDRIMVIDVQGGGTTTLASATAVPRDNVAWTVVKATGASGNDLYGNPIGAEDVYLLAPGGEPPPPNDPPPRSGGHIDRQQTFYTPSDDRVSGEIITFDGGVLKGQRRTRTSQPLVVMAAGGTIDANSQSMVFAGDVTGEGALIVTGGGEVHMNSMVSVPLLVDPSGVLRGTGTINGQTSVFGTLAPGNSPGTLTFSSAVTMQPGATLALDIDGTGTGAGAGNYSRVVVVGDSFTADGTIVPRLRGITYATTETPGTNSYTPPLGQRFAGVVQASGGVGGSFTGLTQPDGLAAGTRVDALYTANAIDLIVTPATYGNLAAAGLPQTSAQSALGLGLDAARPAAGTRMTANQSSVYGALYALAPAALPAALDQLSPLIYADAMMNVRNGWSLMTGAIAGQMGARRGLAQDSGVNTAPGPNGSTIWISALGQYASTRAGGGSPGSSTGFGGTVAGIDMPVDAETMVGVAIGAGGGKVWNTTGGQATVSSGQLQVYGQWRRDAWFVEAQLGGLYQQASIRRDLSVFGVSARGDVDGLAGGGGVRVGMQHRVEGWLIEPSLSFGGFAYSQGGGTESGAGALGATVSRQSLGSAQSVLGLSAQRGFDLGDGVHVVAKGRLGWSHEFAANRGTVRASLSGLSGSGFTQSTAPVGRDAALVGLGADVSVRDWPVTMFVTYGGAFSGSSNAQTVSGGVRFVW